MTKWTPGEFLLDADALAAPLDLPAIFGNDRPVELEIGCGKGTFILARASARPELNLLGIEWAKAYAIYTADRARRAGCESIRMLRTDAGAFVRDFVPDSSIWRVHVYFPDPWPKRRHRRRRLIQPGFVHEVRRILQPGGQFLMVTDHFDYFQQMRNVMEAYRDGFVPVRFPSFTGDEGELVGTNFERKYIAQGRPFFSAAFLRAGGNRQAR